MFLHVPGIALNSCLSFGRPGVDCHVQHEGDVAVTQVLFLVNEVSAWQVLYRSKYTAQISLKGT